MKIVRRYGTTSRKRGSLSGDSCPDILGLGNGDYLVIGKTPGVPHISARELAAHGANIGPGEQAVVVPADVMQAAARDIAAQQPKET